MDDMKRSIPISRGKNTLSHDIYLWTFEGHLRKAFGISVQLHLLPSSLGILSE
jgi:hypothetical protein